MRDKQSFEAYVLEKSKIEKNKIAMRRKNMLAVGTTLCICLIALVVLPGIMEQPPMTDGMNGGSEALPMRSPMPTIQNVGGTEDGGNGTTTKPATTPGMEKLSVQNLMIGFTPKSVVAKEADDRFINSTANFSVALLQQTYDNGGNTLVSPLSVLTALAMTANGADGDTLAQMEQVLGEDLSIENLNQYLYTFLNREQYTEKAKMTIANSIWFRDDADRLIVKSDFLQKNADFYGAAAYKAPFDATTLQEINAWVKENTEGRIENALDNLSPDAMLYLINTLSFDGEWAEMYYYKNVLEQDFTNLAGEKNTVAMMHSAEEKYLNDGKATGFIKRYAGGQYSFVALLPNEGVSLQDYISSLTGTGFRNTFLQAERATVFAALPKFSYDSDIKLNDALQVMGMKNAFDAGVADFSAMGQSVDGNLYIGNVVHKTFITVDERGTQAGAATSIEMNAGGMPPAKTYTVHLDRPFVYAIVDNATGLPVFMGTVVDLG